MRGIRYLLFLIMIGVGLAAGLLIGWVVSPNQSESTPPETLHPSYKADYVLMVAEIYRANQSLEEARGRLAFFKDTEPEQTAAVGLETARELNFNAADLEMINQLVLALKIGGEEQP